MKKNLVRNKEIYIVAILFALLASLYTPPGNWDLVRFYTLYEKFKTLSLSAFWDFSYRMPDITLQTGIYIFAKLSIPLGVLLFLITFITLFNILYVSSKFIEHNNWKSFVFILIAIPIVAVLSGIRNIHAASFILLALWLQYNKKRWWSLLSFLYAILFHYSSILFLPLLFVNSITLKTLKYIWYASFVGLLFYFFSHFIASAINNFIETVNIPLERKIRFYLVREDGYRTSFSGSNSTVNLLLFLLQSAWYFISSYTLFKATRKVADENVYLLKVLFIILSIANLFSAYPVIIQRVGFVGNVIFVIVLLNHKYIKSVFLNSIFGLYVFLYLLEIREVVKKIML